MGEGMRGGKGWYSRYSAASLCVLVCPCTKRRTSLLFLMVGWMLSRRVRSKTLKGDSWAFFLRDVLILLDLEVISLDEWEQ